MEPPTRIQHHFHRETAVMTQNLNLLYSIACAINAATSLVFGLFILFKNPQSKLNQLWCWMSLAITAWGTWIAIAFSTNNYPLALFTLRIADTVAIFIPLLYLHFIITFLQRNDQRRVLTVCYALSILLACFGFSPLYISEARTKMGIHNFAEAGPLFWIFFALYVWEPLHAIRLTWQARQLSTGTRRAHITYVLAAGLVGFFVGGAWFPLCFNIPVSPLPGCFVWLYCIFVTWAVFKYQLFDIRVVVRKSLVYSILITLLTVGYFGMLYLIEQVFQARFGYRSPLVSVTAFALMALAFQPLKVAIQRGVDWLFFRAPHEELVKRMERFEQESRQSEKFKAVATLAAGLSHELRNPLQSIRTFAEFLPQRYDDPAFREKCKEVMQTEIARVNDLLKQLMDFAKPKSPTLQPMEPHKILDSTLDFLNAEFLVRQVHLEKKYEANGVQIQADSDQLRQVILNLVLNALQAIGKEGRVVVSTHQENGWFTLEVTDTGPGIDPKILPKLFEPFATNKLNGTGLGLSIVHAIVKEHRGVISAQNQPGGGATFRVKLPVI